MVLNMLIMLMISVDDDEIFGVVVCSVVSIVFVMFVSIVCFEGDGGLIVWGVVGWYVNELFGVVYEFEGILVGCVLVLGFVVVVVGFYEFFILFGVLCFGYVVVIFLMDWGWVFGVIYLGCDFCGLFFLYVEFDSVISFVVVVEVIGWVWEWVLWCVVDIVVVEECSCIVRDLYDIVI